MIDLLELKDVTGRVIGRVDIDSHDVRCLRCHPAVGLEPPGALGTAAGLGTAVTLLVEHLASVHGELSDAENDDDDEHAAVWGSAYDRLHRSDPAP